MYHFVVPSCWHRIRRSVDLLHMSQFLFPLSSEAFPSLFILRLCFISFAFCFRRALAAAFDDEASFDEAASLVD